ncbi:MAG TPA: RNA polymerase subunit sigma [Gammaproteobacteria bacterium]|jgi:RNA polymerase sigma-70 factor (ECF subfamily)|nr:RNA polymerase subunit sigma [Gammaproteobacteria bacterium]
MYHSASALVSEIYAKHNDWLVKWLHLKLACPHEADDLGQDTFLRLITSKELEHLREPRAYLLVIANRLMMDRRRRKRVESEVLQQVTHLNERVDELDPARIALARDLLRQVLLLLTHELPEKQRKAFLLARVEGNSYREIAEKLSVSQSSVKRYLILTMAHCHSRLYDITA